MLVSGNLILRCAVYSDWHENSHQQPKTPQTTHKLLDVQVGGSRFYAFAETGEQWGPHYGVPVTMMPGIILTSQNDAIFERQNVDLC